MHPQLLPTLLLGVVLSTFGVATHNAHLNSLSHAFLPHSPEQPSSLLPVLRPRRDRSAPTPSPSLAPPPGPASKRGDQGQGKKSKSNSGDATTSQDTSQPTSSTGGSAPTLAPSTIIVSPTPASTADTSTTPSPSSSLSSSTTTSTLLASNTKSPAPSSSPAANSAPAKSSVSIGLIVGVVIAILLVLAALTWVISMRRHLLQREWQFKYHERIFDGPEGLLSRKQQAQQQQKEEVHEMVYPTSFARKGPTTKVTEKALPAHPAMEVPEPERVLFHGREAKRKPVGGPGSGLGR